MARQRIDIPTPALALRRAEAAASLGVSVETFDKTIRHNLPVIRAGGVTVYPVKGIQDWIQANQEEPINQQLRKGRAR